MLNIIPVTPAGPAQKVTELTSSNQTTLIASAVGTAVWQSPTTTLVNASSLGSVVRSTFTGTPDLSGVQIGDVFSATASTNLSNKGAYRITNVVPASYYIEYYNPNRTSATGDETGNTVTGSILRPTDVTVFTAGADGALVESLGVLTTERQNVQLLMKLSDGATESLVLGVVVPALTGFFVSSPLNILDSSTYPPQLISPGGLNIQPTGTLKLNAILSTGCKLSILVVASTLTKHDSTIENS